jgi:hypothetical protein
MFRIFTILVSMLFFVIGTSYNQGMYESYSMGSHILKGAMYLIRMNELVEYLPFGTFVKTFTENCNGIRI